MPKRFWAEGLPFGPNMRMRLLQLLESERRVDVVAQKRAAGFHVPAEHQLDCLAEQGLTESRLILSALADRLAEIFGQW